MALPPHSRPTAAKKPAILRSFLQVGQLEDRTVPNATEWLVQLGGLPGNTREEQLVVAEQRFALADMAGRGIKIVDHLGFNGVLLVRTSTEVAPEDFDAKVSRIEGFLASDEFDPGESRSGKIPVEVGPNLEDEGTGDTPAPDGTEHPHYDSSIGYDGIANTGFRPPDPSGAAGPSSFLQGVNTQFTLSNKATGATIAAASASTFFAPLGGLLSFSDPVVVFNEHTQRYAVGIIDFNTTSLSRYDLAISKSSNPTTFTSADWDFFRYNADDPSAGFDFADYPKMGYNADGYVVSFNQFKNASSYDHVAVLAIRNDGTSPSGTVAVPGGFNNFTLAPASIHDNPVGTNDPFWFVQTGTSSTTISAIQMTNAFTASPTFTFNNVGVNQYFGTQTPHQPSGQLSGNSNLGNRFYFTGLRTVGGVTHLVAAHSSGKPSGDTTFSEVRWYDLNVTGIPSLVQQGSVNAGTNVDTYFPDIDIAPNGAIGLGYMQSGSGAGQFISGFVTGRTPGDAPGTMQAPVLAKAGTANLTPADRIGDYADLSVDPADGSFWYTFEYVGGTGSQAWRTWVHNFAIGATFAVTTTAPAVGSVLSVAPTQYTLDFSSPYAAATVQPGDFTVNGTASNLAVTFVDADTVRFNFSTSPAVEGLNTMTIAAGDIVGTNAVPLPAFTGQFRLDTVPLAVTGTSPASGSVLTLGGNQTIRVNFNEAVAPGTVQTADFVFSAGTVLSATPVLGNTAVDVVVSGLVTEGPITLTIGASAFTDAFGNPNPAGFSANYDLDYVTRAYPTPLAPKNPSGSLIYDPSVSGLVNFAGDTDSFTLNINPNQTVTLLLSPTAAGLRPTIELLAPGGAVLTANTAGAADQNALIQSFTVAAGGLYTFRVSGASSTVGAYSLQVILNAAIEGEGTLTGVTNNTPAAAQDINGSFIGLDTTLAHAGRGAVLGTSDTAAGYTAAAVPFVFTDISGTGTPLVLSGDDSATTTTIPFAFSFYGTGYTSVGVSTNGLLTFGGTDTQYSNTSLSANPALATIAAFWDDLYVNGGTGRVLTQTIGAVGSRQFIVQWNQINFLSDTGADTLTFQAILSEGSNTIRLNYLDLDTAGNSQNGGASATIGVKRPNPTGGQFLDLAFNNGPNAFVGTGKSTVISPVLATADFYKFDAVAGQRVTVAVTNLSAGNVDVQLIGTDGTTVLASGVGGATNLNEAIQRFLLGGTGTYYVRVIGDSTVPYSVVVTKDGVFDAEANDSLAAAQDLTGTQGALGYLEPDSSNQEGFESGNFSRFPWTTSGNANWFVSTQSPATGAFSARSGFIGDSQSSTLSLVLATQAGNISFARRVSSEGSFDFLRFFIDGVQVGSWSGEVPYSTVSFPVTAGTHTFTWTYAKDGSIASGFDAAFLDDILFPIPAGVGQDWYKVTLAAGETILEVETRTPADGTGEFVNTLNPKVQVFNAGGTDITGSVTILGDGRNEKVRVTGLTAGATYFVKVSGEGSTAGEYFVGVKALRTPTVTTKVDDALPFGVGPDGTFSVSNPVGNGWTNVTGSGYLNDYTVHADNVNEVANNFANWTIKVTPDIFGNFELFTSWVARPQNATNATYQVLEGTTVRATVTVNQKLAPNDALFGTTLLKSLGTFQKLNPATTYFSVRLLTVGANGDVVADGVFDPPSDGVIRLAAPVADGSVAVVAPAAADTVVPVAPPARVRTADARHALAKSLGVSAASVSPWSVTAAGTTGSARPTESKAKVLPPVSPAFFAATGVTVEAKRIAAATIAWESLTDDGLDRDLWTVAGTRPLRRSIRA